jgi:hypothetical protein
MQESIKGHLIYIKPTFYGTEPADVYNYAQSCTDFPHETTADQFFSESQFESYRRLGEHIFDEIIRIGGHVPFDQLHTAAKKYVETVTKKKS